MTRFVWTDEDRAKLVPGATVELVGMGFVLGKNGRYTVHRFDPVSGLWVAGGDIGVSLEYHADPSSILPPGGEPRPTELELMLADAEAERDEARRQLAAEQAAHARFVQRISRALGDYTGSFEDACIARLEEHATIVVACDRLKSRFGVSGSDKLSIIEDLSKQVRELKSFQYSFTEGRSRELDLVVAYARCAHNSPEVERFCDALWQGEHRKEPEDG